jgi:hypothetical protein
MEGRAGDAGTVDFRKDFLMTAEALDRILLPLKQKPAAWHGRLADELARRMRPAEAAMTVFGVFMTATLSRENGLCLIFTDYQRYRRAQEFKTALEGIFFRKVDLQFQGVKKSGDFQKEVLREELKANYRERGLGERR